uniref:Uncharacterized protein n=1 Tax=Glossina pallidipes TaxID=7398 RepID=A0A1A9ZUC5_GLOPL
MNVNSNERKDYYDVDDVCNMFCIICQPVLLFIFLSCCRNGRDWFSYEDNVHSSGETTNHAKATIINDADYKEISNFVQQLQHIYTHIIQIVRLIACLPVCPAIAYDFIEIFATHFLHFSIQLFRNRNICEDYKNNALARA